jgi:flagellar biosynthesis protein FliR
VASSTSSPGLSVATVFDPMQGDQGGVFARMFHLTAVTMFLVGGGLVLLVGGLVAACGCCRSTRRWPRSRADRTW